MSCSVKYKVGFCWNSVWRVFKDWKIGCKLNIVDRLLFGRDSLPVFCFSFCAGLVAPVRVTFLPGKSESLWLSSRLLSNQKPAGTPRFPDLPLIHPGLRSLPSMVFRGATGLCLDAIRCDSSWIKAVRRLPWLRMPSNCLVTYFSKRYYQATAFGITENS
jgi:hypothetical protein